MDPKLLEQFVNNTKPGDIKDIINNSTETFTNVFKGLGLDIEQEKLDQSIKMMGDLIDNGEFKNVVTNIANTVTANGSLTGNIQEDFLKNAQLLSNNEAIKNMFNMDLNAPMPKETTLKEKLLNTPEPTVKTEEEQEGIDDLIPITEDIHVKMNVTLKILYCGAKKKVRIQRKNFKIKENGENEIFNEKKVLTIEIKPGMDDGSEIVLKGEGDKLPNHKSGDIIITLKLLDDPEDMYKREGDSLMLNVDINLAQNYKLSGQIRTLDGRILTIKPKEDDKCIMNQHNGVRKIIGEGFPIEGTNKKGDLYVRFRLSLPDEMQEDKIKLLEQIFEMPTLEPSDTIVTPELVDESEIPEDSSYYSSDSEYDSESSYSDEEEEEEDLNKDTEDLVEDMINKNF